LRAPFFLLATLVLVLLVSCYVCVCGGGGGCGARILKKFAAFKKIFIKKIKRYRLFKKIAPLN
jgi:hypothetical protein